MVGGGSTWVPLDPDAAQLVSVTAFDVGDAVAGPTSVATVAGVSGTVYASPESLYIAAAHVGSWWDSTDVGVTTNVYRFDIAAARVELASMGAVPGYVLDQFSMDEHEGLFRVATTNWSTAGEWSFTNTSAGVYVLGEDGGDLVGVGSVTGLAPGERIYSARFAGDVAYVSTFRQVDPLFVVDLSVPEKPARRGAAEGARLLDAPPAARCGPSPRHRPRRRSGHGPRPRGAAVAVRRQRSEPAAAGGHPHLLGRRLGIVSPALWDHRALAWFPAAGILTLPVQQGDSSGGGSDARSRRFACGSGRAWDSSRSGRSRMRRR